MRARLLVGLAVAAAVAVPVPASAAPAAPSADATAAAGWWQSSIGGTVPPNPSVPTGGLYVALGPTGTTGISALRAPAGTATKAVLTLTLASAATTPTVAVQACATTTSWTPVAGGDLASAPTYDPAQCVAGVVTGSTVVWTFTAGSFRGGVLDVALVPAGTTPFSAPFAAPAADALTLSGSAGTTPAPAGSTAPTAVATDAPAPATGGTAPVQTVPLEVAPPPALTSTPPSAQVAPAPTVAPSAPASAPVAATRVAAEGSVPRTVVLVLFGALVVAAIVFGRRRQSLDVARGIGRFARVHDHEVPKV